MVSLGSPIDQVARAVTRLPRLIVYFQTTHDASGMPISMLPLVTEKGIALTHLIVCSLHVNENGQIHLNDYQPDDPRFYTLWNETEVMKNAGVKVMGMVGGAAPGSFTSGTLDGDEATFDKYYRQLRRVIRNFKLQGLDIDVEQPMSQAGIDRLVDRLRSDFGRGFTVTLTPVASALSDGGNLSGFDYKLLDARKRSKIDFYNGQFYSGFGDMSTTADYDRIVSNGFSPSRLVAGQLTSPRNGFGYIPYQQLNATVISLRSKYKEIGGVMGWEYFNSAPGATEEPWKWAQIMTQILRPNSVPSLTISRDIAQKLATAFSDSTKSHRLWTNGTGGALGTDYHAMINV
ncbi:endo-N-acetyl-beta-D-glucosaminidase precursor [Metarhizium album ARSEF 1941]|uniref:Endo-N-acetyl-beta-D-glucosaminidase n=1 Tax=Metarhizium album (strain ARSEF 1941) TaxID=1081103 RepID=A0A0B2WDH6_METAS|nr:endo-N-acetyl-beta-D-glucosaminidase precursor [Metarhizium album ARSEF 1941]KHN93916.1 endo-N-acetyl-beta-D-glucosaminidase precursor [Metarhizium album ARSEF 1941]